MHRPERKPAPEQDAEYWRLFVAIPAPPPVVVTAQGLIASLRGAGDVRWVPGERMHLTLKFLGGVPSDQVPALKEHLAKTANTFSRFVVELSTVGAFPGLRRPQTVWLGVRDPDDRPLTGLAEAVDRSLSGLGFLRETRPFRAHVTLGRLKSSRGISILATRLEAARETLPEVSWAVDEFHLVRSVLRQDSPEYTVLEAFPLRPEEQEASRRQG